MKLTALFSLFILFVSTEAVGKNGYMTWDQIREVQNSKIGIIGNHSHTHDYLVDLSNKKINHDIDQSLKIFKKELGLTDEQVAQFKALQNAHKQEGNQLHDSVKLLRTVLFEEALNSTQNKATIDTGYGYSSRQETFSNFC